MKARAAIEYLKQLPPEEPVFVLRAQDQLAARTVGVWATLAEQEGVRSGKVAGARDCSEEMSRWPTQKLPD